MKKLHPLFPVITLLQWRVRFGKNLPQTPQKLDGDTDILLGSKYKRYFLKLVFELDSGLGIHNFTFASKGGKRGVPNGPHKYFAEVENQTKGSHMVYYEYRALLIRSIPNLNEAILLANYKNQTSF